VLIKINSTKAQKYSKKIKGVNMRQLLTILTILAITSSILSAGDIIWGEDFENLTGSSPYSLPAGWLNYSPIVGGMGVQILDNMGANGTVGLKYHASGQVDMHGLFLYTPVVQNIPVDATFKMDYRIMQTGSLVNPGNIYGAVEIYACDPADPDYYYQNILYLSGIEPTTEWRTISIPLTNYINQSKVFWIYTYNSPADNYDIYIDNVRVEIPYDYDLMAQTVTGLNTITQGISSNYRFSVTNIGYQTAGTGSYQVALFMTDANNNNEMIGASQPGVALARGETATFTFPWQPTTAGNFQLYGQVTYDIDEDDNNNITALHNVTVGTNIIYDLSVSMVGATELALGVESTYTFTVNNVGVIRANAGDYNVSLKMVVQGNEDVTIGSSQAGQGIDPEGSLTYTFAWTPNALERFQIYAMVDYTVDVNPANNTTAPMDVVVLPVGLTEVDLFFPQNYITVNHPVNYNYCNSLSQTIYTKEELGGWASEGKIWKLTMRFQRDEQHFAVPDDIPVQIYLANAPATLTSFASVADYYAYSNFVKVYDAPLNLGAYDSVNDIPIYLGTGAGTADFEYEGENLILMMFKQDNAIYWNNYWHLNEGSADVYRVIFQAADDPIIDVEHPVPTVPGGSAMSVNFPMIKFYIEGVDYGTTLTVNVTDEETGAPIENAVVYVAESPNIFTEANTAGVYVLSNISMEWDIAVSALGYTTQRFTPAQIQWNTETRTATLGVELGGRPTGLSISGYVKLPDTGLGVNNVTVALDGYMSSNTVTANDAEGNPGYFIFQGLFGLTDYTLTATINSPPLVINNTEYGNPETQDIHLGAASINDATIRLLEIMVYPINVRATANAEDTEALITWFNPLWEYNSFSHAQLRWETAFGIYDVGTFSVAHRYTADHLASNGVTGWDLYKVGFIPNEAGATYTLKVWVTDNADLANPGTLTPVVSVPIPAVSVGVVNEVFLPTYVAIPVAAQIFVGYEVNTQGGLPAAYTYYPENNGYSNLLQVNGNWTTLQAQYYYGSWSIYLTAIAPDSNLDNATPVVFSQVTPPTQQPQRPIQFAVAEGIGSENPGGTFRLGHTPSRVTRSFNGSFEIHRVYASSEAGNTPLETVTGLPITQRNMQFTDTSWGNAATPQIYKYAVKTVHEGEYYQNNFPTSGPVYSNNILKALVGSLTVNVSMQDNDVTGAIISLSHENLLIPNLSYTLLATDNGSHTFPDVYLSMPYQVKVILAGGTTYSSEHLFTHSTTTLNVSLLPKTPLLSQAFNAGEPTNWANIDANNDGLAWGFNNASMTGPGGTGTTAAYSESFSFSVGTVYPDNWLISPPIYLPEDVPAGLEFYIAAKNQSYLNDRILVYIAPDNGTTTPGWQTFLENRDQTGGNYGNPDSEVTVTGATKLDDHRTQAYLPNNGFYKLEYDISSYEGQTVRIAIRHAFCQDREAVKVADFLVYSLEFMPIQVSGIVVDVNGNPISEASVTISSTLPINAVTDNTGGFALQNVPGNTRYTVTVFKTGYSSASADITVENINYVITEPIVLETDLHESDVTKPNVTALKANYPNPFNPTTTIAFDIAKSGHVAIDVYNAKGQRVKTLANRVFEAGSHHLVWNGTDYSGKTVGSGIYFYRMTTNDYSGIHKMLLMK